MQSTYTPFERVWKMLDSTGAPLLRSWRQDAIKNKPYKGIKIYHNTPLSLETICKVEALCAAGAHVVVSSNDFLIPATFSEARKLLDEMGLEYRPKKHADLEEFDFYLDCCAELSDLPPPKCGAVELTRTGALVYQSKKTNIPVLSVDNSYIKMLETFYGTGESFLRAFQQLSGKNIQKEAFAIIGYGKVGKGICSAIRKQGGHCIIFDKSSSACEKARLQGFLAYSPLTEEGLSALNNASVVVTVTGYKNILTQVFPDAEKRLADKIICNMGADDEIGEGFKNSKVLAGGLSINFTLQHPTLMRYLDPSFYAHNLGVQILSSQLTKPGFHPLPKEIDLAILNRWAEIHHEPIDCILND
ncbi:MAG: NAD-binding protein [Verrucomicrobia bacterium]|nr:NAD-binding protein [Verrucomicrobiota bacterium]